MVEVMDKLFECNACKSMLTVDNVWISDLGPLCSTCCSVHYGTKPNENINHTHDWKEYIGFRETYKYCAVCDAKAK